MGKRDNDNGNGQRGDLIFDRVARHPRPCSLTTDSEYNRQKFTILIPIDHMEYMENRKRRKGNRLDQVLKEVRPKKG